MIHELVCGRPVEPFRDSNRLQVTAAPWLPDGHSDCPGGQVGYRRGGESGLSVSKYFSCHDLRILIGKESPRVSHASTVRGDPLRPSDSGLGSFRDRYSFPAAGRAARLTPRGRSVDCHSRLWWPARRDSRRRANRELRCESGTAPPLYPGAEVGRFEPLWPCPVPGPSREKACGRLSLGVRRPTRAREFAFLRGRGGRHGRPRPVERSSSNAPASTRSAGGVNGPGSDCARAGAWRCACMR